MSFTNRPWEDKLRKAARYWRLYGVDRTLVKIRSQYHMNRRFDPLPPRHAGDGEGRHVGILGCGSFAFGVVAYYLRKEAGNVIRGVMDIDAHRAASLREHYRADYYTTEAAEIIADPKIDLVYVVSNHASHARYAIDALRAGKSLHLEKPPAVTRDQLRDLCRAVVETHGRVRLGFNRSSSRLGADAIATLHARTGPAVLSWFVYGHDIPAGHWYLAEGEGGRVAGNLCHWIDFVRSSVPPEARYPITIYPVRADVADDNLAVSYRFADGTIASIAFGSRGETFEGIRERFAAQKAGVYLTLDDFESLAVWDGATVRRRRSFRRDHGHRATIVASYGLAKPDASRPSRPIDVADLWEVGELTIATRDALERETAITVEAYSEQALA